jgi:hypothetical protein
VIPEFLNLVSECRKLNLTTKVECDSGMFELRDDRSWKRRVRVPDVKGKLK